jgi:O-antigen/teichoic acid export membrane protein
MGQFRNQFTPARVAIAVGIFAVALGFAIFMQVQYPPFGKVPPTATREQWNDYWWLFALCVVLVAGTNFMVLRAAKRRQERMDAIAPEPVTDVADERLNPLRQTGPDAE